MDILTKSQKEEAVRISREIAKNDEKKFFNLKNLFGALQILENTLGIEWCRRMFTDSKNKSNNLSVREIVLSGDPKDWVNLIHFAECVKDLWNSDTNIKEKLIEYSQTSSKPNTIVDEDKFSSTLFELTVAHLFSSKGFKIKFIKEYKKRKTPEMKIISSTGTIVFLECKRKKFQEEYKKEDLLDPISKADKQFESLNEMGILFLLIPFSTSKIREQNLLQKYDDYITSSLKNFPNLYFVSLISQSIRRDLELIRKGMKQSRVIENSQPRIEPTREIFEVLLNPSPPKRGLRCLLD